MFVSLEMVKFVCYSMPSTNMSELITRISAVYSLQRSEQINLAKQEGRLNNMESFNNEEEKSIMTFKENLEYNPRNSYMSCCSVMAVFLSLPMSYLRFVWFSHRSN